MGDPVEQDPSEKFRITQLAIADLAGHVRRHGFNGEVYGFDTGVGTIKRHWVGE